MRLIFLSWKYLLRSKARTIFSILAILIVSLGLTMYFNLVKGMTADLMKMTKSMETGDLRIRHEQYDALVDLAPLHLQIENYQNVMDSLSREKNIKQIVARIPFGASLYKEDTLEAVTLLAWKAEEEKIFTEYTLLEGRLPLASGEILVSPDMITSFDLQIGDVITLLVQTIDRSSNARSFTVVGVISFGIPSYDHHRIFMEIPDAQNLLFMEGVTEILISLQDPAKTLLTASQVHIQEWLDSEALPFLLKRWDENPILSMIEESMSVARYLMSFIFFLLAATVLFNTVMMSVIERRKEIGIMMSCGFFIKEIRRVFLYEALTLGSVGALLGVLIGHLISIPFVFWGFSGGSDEFKEEVSFALPSTIYFSFDVFGSFTVFCFSLLMVSSVALWSTHSLRKMQVQELLRSR